MLRSPYCTCCRAGDKSEIHSRNDDAALAGQSGDVVDDDGERGHVVDVGESGDIGESGDGKAVGWFLVCEYWPPGNVVGDHNEYFKENVQPVVSLSVGLKVDGAGVWLMFIFVATLSYLL